MSYVQKQMASWARNANCCFTGLRVRRRFRIPGIAKPHERHSYGSSCRRDLRYVLCCIRSSDTRLHRDWRWKLFVFLSCVICYCSMNVIKWLVGIICHVDKPVLCSKLAYFFIAIVVVNSVVFIVCFAFLPVQRHRKSLFSDLTMLILLIKFGIFI